MDMKSGIKLAHFQLRSILATTSRTRAFYPGYYAVHQFNPVSGQDKPVIELAESHGSWVTTIGAAHGVLVAGHHNGQYSMRHIDSNEPASAACHEGVITTHASGISNHVQVHQSRTSSSPIAAFASNDMGFRTLDIATEQWLVYEAFDFALNCTAVSPDRRLRVVVGDHLNVLITAAQSTLPGGKPEVLQSLSGHRDNGFACDWADDGWTVATGFQDRSVKIWDARRWTDSSGRAIPVCTIRSEMAGVRNLRFSPVGSGKRVLVAAEDADYVSIIDAQTYRSKQTVDLFSEIGGISFTEHGQCLSVLCCDRARGGIVQLERCGAGEETTWDADQDGPVYRPGFRARRGASYDWQPTASTDHRRIRESISRRRRKGASLDAIEPF